MQCGFYILVTALNLIANFTHQIPFCRVLTCLIYVCFLTEFLYTMRYIRINPFDITTSLRHLFSGTFLTDSFIGQLISPRMNQFNGVSGMNVLYVTLYILY